MACVRPSFTSSRFRGLVLSNLVFTDTELGRGAISTVYEVEWNGTRCAAKRLLETLLEDESRRGVDKLLNKIETDCVTWSKLRHPNVVQFLGVYLERGSRLPVLVMEKLDASLRQYLESHSKEEFQLHLKAFLLRQVSQALTYLHSQNPPLVHHDLNTNNVLLNVVSFVTKLSDFGMGRAINPSVSRKSSIKGTPAFMPPEALQKPPHYNEKLDIFSFGNVILSTITHRWPEPCPPTLYKGDQLIALDEFQRRERYVEMFTAQEKQLFLPTVRRCLENQPDKCPSSAVLVQELRRIESTLPRDGHVAAPIEQLYQQLSAKEEECRQKDAALRQKDEVLKEKDSTIQAQQDAIQEKKDSIQALCTAIQKQRDTNRAQRTAIQKEQSTNEALRATIQAQQVAIEEQQTLNQTHLIALQKQQDANLDQQTSLQSQQVTIQAQQVEIERLRNQLAVTEQVKASSRNWCEIGECQKIIRHSPRGGVYYAVAVTSEGLLALTDLLGNCVHLLTEEGKLLRSIGEDVLGGLLYGVAFDLRGNIWVTDCDNNKVVKLSLDGQILQTVCRASSGSVHLGNPSGVAVNAEGLIYVSDPDNHRVTVHNEEGKFLFAFGSKGSGPGCFDGPGDVAFGSDGLVYITDLRNERVCVWLKDGTFKRDFKTESAPTCIAATSDNHLLITSLSSHVVMVYTVEGQLVHQFGGKGCGPGRFNLPEGICIDHCGLVYVVDSSNERVQVF